MKSIKRINVSEPNKLRAGSFMFLKEGKKIFFYIVNEKYSDNIYRNVERFLESR